MSFDLNNLLAGLIFGLIGIAGWKYGRATSKPKKMILGVALILYPYLVENNFALWGIGLALTSALCFWREE